MTFSVNQNEVKSPYRGLSDSASAPTPHLSNLMIYPCSLSLAILAFCSFLRSFAPAFPSAWNSFPKITAKLASLHLGPCVNVSISKRTSQILLLKTAPFPSITLLSFSEPLLCFVFLHSPFNRLK